MGIGLEIKQTNDRGLGVFATKLFERGELIECCRVIIIPRKEIVLSGFTGPVMRDYVWEWDEKLAIPTGYGCYYNHSYQPNAINYKHIDLGQIHFHALKDIQPYDEIVFNYGGSPDCTDTMWFEVKGS